MEMDRRFIPGDNIFCILSVLRQGNVHILTDAQFWLLHMYTHFRKTANQVSTHDNIF